MCLFYALSDEPTIESTLQRYTSPNYTWYGVHPFRKKANVHEACQAFWKPLLSAFSHLQRREDVFIAGNDTNNQAVWVMSMGHFFGLFDHDILGIPCTRKLATLRYVEFNCIENQKIIKTGIFVDFIGLMQQSGVNSLPQSTGHYFNYPGPKNHDGILHKDANSQESSKTLELVERMVQDLDGLNIANSMTCPRELLKKTWSENMLWYGPAGIGATYTIDRYQQQHQLPFRSQLADKKFHGHLCRFAEGDYACFFGWPNLSNSPTGGWLGLPGGAQNISMQVVDIYRREQNKLIENWVFIDIPYWLQQQGLDIFKRNADINNTEYTY